MGRYDLKGKGALVTGASRGIGRSTALELARRGARVAISARSEPELNLLAEEIAQLSGRAADVLPADLSVPGAGARLAQAASQALDGVDVLMNNAGAITAGSGWSLGDGDSARSLFELDLWSPMALISELVPPMIDRGHGAVVNVTSVFQSISWPGFGHYSAAKAALGIASESLRMEAAPLGVRVIEVIPGPVDTRLRSESLGMFDVIRMIRLVPSGTPEVLARRVVSAVERGRGRIHYPRMTRMSFAMPALGRRAASRIESITRRPARTEKLVVGEVYQTGAGDRTPIRPS